MVIAHNMAAMNSQRQYNLTTGTKQKSTEKLSSGYKINRAADDAAGLTISEKMRSQIRGLTQASDNSQDGISFVQIADGALAEVQDMLDRMTELTVKASNGTNTEADHAAIQKEIAQLTSEIDRVHETTHFNTIEIFSDKGHNPSENISNNMSINETPNGFSIGGISISFDFVDSSGAVSDAEATHSTSGTNNYPVAFTKFVKQAAQNAITNIFATYPKLADASSANIQIGLNADKSDGLGKTLASAELLPQSGNGVTGLTYILNIDKEDFDPNTFDPDSANATKLASTIAHEMTHLVMFDTLTSKMATSNSFPLWFIEGMAQTASGDGGWVSQKINPSASNSEIKNYMKQIGSMPYGAGYLATMALGLEITRAANPTASATSENIKNGLNKFLGQMVDQERAATPVDVDTSISNATNGKYTSLNAFYNSYKNGSDDLLTDVKDILNARGATGSGSLFDDLSKTASDIFGNVKSMSDTQGNYAIDTDHKAVRNDHGGKILAPMPSSSGGISGSNGGDIILQVGAHSGQEIAIKRFNMKAESIFDYESVDCSTEESSKSSMQTVVDAKARVSNVRSYYGAMQNRLEHTIKNLDNVVENTQAAESQIRDTDMAAEMVKLTTQNILQQAGEAMMAQANQSTQGVLSLLQ